MTGKSAILALLLGALWPAVSPAQPLPVYTGEHADFTRVVVGLPDGASWSLSPQNDGTRYVLEVAGSARGFALEEFWRRIDRDRIASVGQGTSANSLVFDLACRCAVQEQGDGQGHLVIDFRDGDEDGAGPVVPVLSASTGTPPLSPLPRNSAAAAVAERLGADAGDEASSTDDAFRSVIMENFASAISAGLLDIDSPGAALSAVNEIRGEDAAAIVPAPEAPAPEGIDCTAFAFLDSRRGEDVPHSLETVAALRLDLMDGGGKLDESTVRRLIEAYLALGLGQEAIPLLDRYEGADAADLRMLARLVEDGGGGPPDLAKRAACGRDGHVWAAFAQGADPSLIDADAVLASFDLWPDSLRERLGPPLARSLRQKGLASAARRALERLERRPEEATDAWRLEAAHLAEEASADDFAELSSSSDDDVAVAAVNALAQEPETPQQASDLADLTETLVREYRGSGQEVELVAAHVTALVAAGEYERAFEVLEGGANLETAQRESLVRRAVEAALDDADEARALSFLLGRAEAIAGTASVPDSVKLAVADRLAASQLPEAAETWLRAVGNPRLLQDRRLTEARAALANRQPERAEIALIGLEGEAAEILRRQAREMMGDFAYLDSRRGEDMPPELRQEAAILAGNWRGLPEDAPAEWSSVADLVTSDRGTLDPGDLASFEALANEAGAARSSLEELLRETAVSED